MRRRQAKEEQEEEEEEGRGKKRRLRKWREEEARGVKSCGEEACEVEKKSLSRGGKRKAEGC